MNKVCDEGDFLHADKHQRFLKGDTNILGGCSQTCRQLIELQNSQKGNTSKMANGLLDFYNIEIFINNVKFKFK